MTLPIRVDLLRRATESIAPQVVYAPLKIVDGGCPDEHLFAPRIPGARREIRSRYRPTFRSLSIFSAHAARSGVADSARCLVFGHHQPERASRRDDVIHSGDGLGRSPTLQIDPSLISRTRAESYTRRPRGGAPSTRPVFLSSSIRRRESATAAFQVDGAGPATQR